MFTGFEVRQLGRGPPHRPAHRARGDPRGAARGDRARSTGRCANVTFQGTARHHDGEPAASVAVGLVHLDTRFDTLGLATDVALEPLSFDGIRRAFPTLGDAG